MIKNQFTTSRARDPGSGRTGGPETNGYLGKGLNPYSVLGLKPDCSNDEIGNAYRNLANKYHPDKVSHLGREFIDLATRKFTYIQKAYEQIKLQRGLH